MKTLAFLQNQWFRDPNSVRRIYQHHAGDYNRLAKLDKRFLFAGCLSGRRLKGAFGAMVDEIVWANASPVISDHASAKPPADLVHMRKLMEHHQPGLVLAFGAVAAKAVAHLDLSRGSLVLGPHPAARSADTTRKLREMARLARAIVSRPSSPAGEAHQHE